MKVNKTQQQLDFEVKKQLEKKNYDAFVKRMKDETADYKIRIDWMQSKILAEELAEKLQGKENVEKALYKNIIDSVLDKLNLQDKVVELYTHFGLQEFITTLKVDTEPTTKAE